MLGDGRTSSAKPSPRNGFRASAAVSRGYERVVRKVGSYISRSGRLRRRAAPGLSTWGSRPFWRARRQPLVLSNRLPKVLLRAQFRRAGTRCRVYKILAIALLLTWSVTRSTSCVIESGSVKIDRTRKNVAGPAFVTITHSGQASSASALRQKPPAGFSPHERHPASTAFDSTGVRRTARISWWSTT